MTRADAASNPETGARGSAAPASVGVHRLNRRAVLGGTLGAAAAALGGLAPPHRLRRVDVEPGLPDPVLRHPGDGGGPLHDVLPARRPAPPRTRTEGTCPGHHAGDRDLRRAPSEIGRGAWRNPGDPPFQLPARGGDVRGSGCLSRTQQLAEELTNGALNAWANDMATNGQARLAQLGAQLQQVEGGHRVAGRALAGEAPYGNWAFGPIVLNSFLDVPQAITAAGFLSLRPGNDFAFTPAPAAFPGVINTTPGQL